MAFIGRPTAGTVQGHWALFAYRAVLNERHPWSMHTQDERFNGVEPDVEVERAADVFHVLQARPDRAVWRPRGHRCWPLARTSWAVVEVVSALGSFVVADGSTPGTRTRSHSSGPRPTNRSTSLGRLLQRISGPGH
jgi:hypothetical protein